MSTTVTRTKIRIPYRREDLISRENLIGNPSEILDYPFTLISAPAGYGKTSLLIDLAHRASYPVCWYSLDPLDKDPLRFFTHLIHAVKMQFPGCGNGFLSMLENLPKPAQKIDQLATALVNDLYSAIQEHFVFIMDDFHDLDDQPDICRFISKLGMEMDENAHLVISSRKQIWFPDLALLIGRRQVRGIDQVDLAFNTEEIEAFLKNVLDNPVSKERAEDLYHQTEGWITGMLLLAYQGSGLPDIQAKAVKVTGANIADYYDAQVMGGINQHTRKGMLASSLLDQFNAQICQEIFGEPDGISWTELVQALIENNLFVELIDDQQPWFRYHQLFKDYLLDQFDQLDQTERLDMLQNLLDWLIGQEDWEKAFAIARKLGDPLTMAQVISQASSPLFHAGRINLLADWLDILPESAYYQYPTLKILKGILITSLGDPISGLSELNRTLSNSKFIENDTVYFRGLLCRATTNRLIGNYNQSLKDITTLLDNQALEGSLPLLVAEAKRESGLLFNIMGNYEKSLNSLSDSLNLYKSINDSKNASLVHMDLGLILMNHGKINEAKQHYLDSLTICEKFDNQMNLSILHNNLGILSMLFGKFQDAMKYLDQGQVYATNSSHKRMQAFINASMGDMAYALNKHQTSKTYYTKALKLAKGIHEGYLIIYIEICLSKVSRLLGDFRQSNNHLDDISAKVKTKNTIFERGLWSIEKGFQDLAVQMHHQSMESFITAHKIFQASDRPYELAKALIGLLLSSWAENDLGTVEEYLVELDQILDTLESLHPLLPEIGHHLAEFQNIAAAFPGRSSLKILLDQTDRYLASLPDLQRQIFPPLQTGEDPDLLTIQAFGDIEVRKGGNRITASEWIHQKTVRELLYYLLSQPRGVTKDQVGLVFWPESSPDLLNIQFKNAVYRLRRALGKESVLYDYETRSYMFNREINYRYDVEAFQAAIHSANREHRPGSKKELFRKAISLYRHPFGPQLEGVWAEPIRQSLYLKYEKAQLWIARDEFKIGNIQRCIEVCTKIINLEPCQEEAYHLCMKSYGKLGDMTNLHRIYQECCNNFSNNLLTTPSNTTISLYNLLISE